MAGHLTPSLPRALCVSSWPHAGKQIRSHQRRCTKHTSHPQRLGLSRVPSSSAYTSRPSSSVSTPSTRGNLLFPNSHCPSSPSSEVDSTSLSIKAAYWTTPLGHLSTFNGKLCKQSPPFRRLGPDLPAHAYRLSTKVHPLEMLCSYIGES